MKNTRTFLRFNNIVGALLIMCISLGYSSVLRAIEVELDVSLSLEEDGKLHARGTSSLPDKTKVIITVDNKPGEYYAYNITRVLGNKFESGDFTSKTGAIKDGDYNVIVTIPIAREQPKSVRQVIGSKGEKMAGPYVLSVGYDGQVAKLSRKISIKDGKLCEHKPEEKAEEKAEEKPEQKPVDK